MVAYCTVCINFCLKTLSKMVPKNVHVTVDGRRKWWMTMMTEWLSSKDNLNFCTTTNHVLCFCLGLQAVNIDWPPRIDPVPEEDGDTAAAENTIPHVNQPESRDHENQQQDSHEMTAATEVPAWWGCAIVMLSCIVHWSLSSQLLVMIHFIFRCLI